MTRHRLEVADVIRQHGDVFLDRYGGTLSSVQRRALSDIAACRTEAEYVALREARDRTLPMPKLILHALQVNINGGRLPEPEANGRRYLKFPLDALDGAAWD